MQFLLHLHQQENNKPGKLLQRLWSRCTKLIFTQIDANQLFLSVNEFESKLSFVSDAAGSTVVQNAGIKESIKRAWISPFGCWLASQQHAFFVHRYSMQEAQFRCLCRMLVWQQYENSTTQIKHLKNGKL